MTRRLAAPLLFWAGSALAQSPPPMLPGVALPALDVPADQLADACKYCSFHQTGVSLAQAEADLAYCWRFLPHGLQRKVPGVDRRRSGTP